MLFIFRCYYYIGSPFIAFGEKDIIIGVQLYPEPNNVISAFPNSIFLLSYIA